MISQSTLCKDSLEIAEKAELPEGFIKIMATSKEVMKQAGEVIGNNVSVLEQDVQPDLRIHEVLNEVEITEGDQQLDGQPAVITEPKELFALETVDTVVEVAERVERVLKSIENTETIPGLSNKDPENCEGQASAELEKPETNLDEAKMRIAQMCLETEETLKLFEEAEKTLELLEESDNILSKLQENLQMLQEERMSTKDNSEKVSQKLEMAINTSASEFEQLNVDDNLLVHSISPSGPESLEANDPSMTATSLSDPSVRENGPDSQPTFLQRIRNSMGDHCKTFCIVSACYVCLLCFVMCKKP